MYGSGPVSQIYRFEEKKKNKEGKAKKNNQKKCHLFSLLMLDLHSSLELFV